MSYKVVVSDKKPVKDDKCFENGDLWVYCEIGSLYSKRPQAIFFFKDKEWLSYVYGEQDFSEPLKDAHIKYSHCSAQHCRHHIFSWCDSNRHNKIIK